MATTTAVAKRHSPMPGGLSGGRANPNNPTASVDSGLEGARIVNFLASTDGARPLFVRCAHRAARATATLPESVRVENSEDYPRGLLSGRPLA